MHWTVCLGGGPRRVNHSAVAYGEHIFSFGGYCSEQDNQLQRPIDVHILNTVTLRWSSLPTTQFSRGSQVPFHRYGHTVVVYKDAFYLWGGRNDQGACNTLFRFDALTLKWSCPPVSGNVPPARDGHSSCVISHTMYIFGGYEDYARMFSQDVCGFNFNTMTWTHIQTGGVSPQWRDFHSATALGPYMYVFGGRGDRDGPIHTGNEIYCNQIVRLDTRDNTWTHLLSRGRLPQGRRSHSAFVYKGKLYIFGGYNESILEHFGDIHCFDPVSRWWSLVKVGGKGPCPRRRQECCIVQDRLFLFGGTSPRKGFLPFAFHGSLEDHSLKDHADLYILDFGPSLKTLCLLLVIEKDLDQSTLPDNIRLEISWMTKENCISAPESDTD